MMTYDQAIMIVAAADYLNRGDKVTFITLDGEIKTGKVLSFDNKFAKVTDDGVTQMWKIERSLVEKIDSDEVRRARKLYELAKLPREERMHELIKFR